MLGPEFWIKYLKALDAFNSLPTYTRLLSDLFLELDPKQGDIILDVASNTGNFSLRIRESGSRVVALDYCREALERHRDKDRRSNLIQADLTKKLPFIDNCFDRIVSYNTLYTLPSSEQISIVMEMHRVLKPDGKIVLANWIADLNILHIMRKAVTDNIQADGLWTTIWDMAVLMPRAIKMAYYSWKLWTESQYHRLEPEEQRVLLEDAGFQIIPGTKKVYAGQIIVNSAFK